MARSLEGTEEDSPVGARYTVLKFRCPLPIRQAWNPELTSE